MFNISKKPSPYYPTVTFIGVLFTLIGLFALGRVILNVTFSNDKYPTVGVLPNLLSLSYQPPFIQREEDCDYPQVYYSQDGSGVRQPNPQELSMERSNKERCLASIAANRDAVKLNDLTQTAFFIFVGLGLLLSRPIFFRKD